MPHFNDLATTALDPGVPQDERWDANSELLKKFRADVNNPARIEEIREDLLGNSYPLRKAVQLEPYWYETRPPRDHPRAHTSVLQLNEYGIVDNSGGKSRWLEKRSKSGFHLLKDMVNHVDLLAAVNLTRIRQIRPFGRPERDQGPLGFRISRADGEKCTEADKPECRRIERFLLSNGDKDDYFERQRLRRTDLDGFLTKLLWDTLSGDACPIELTRTNGGKLSGFHNIDFSTVRLCSEFGYEGRDEIRAVQVIDGIAHIAYAYPDLIYEVRNCRTDIYSGGYGFAEPEMVLRAVTGYLNAVTYNASGIDRSAVPRGILTLIGEYDADQLESGKRLLKLMLTGAANRHQIPVFAAKERGGGALWTPIDQFNEMFFARWMVFLVSVICAVYGIDPSEIHFDSFNIRTSSLAGKDTAEKLSLSRDKGLVPLLGFVEKVLNIIVQLLNPKYRFEFVGLHEEDEQRKADRIRLSGTVDELRDMDGKDPHKDKVIGGAPVSEILMPLYMQRAAQQGMLGQGPDLKVDAKHPNGRQGSGAEQPNGRQESGREGGDSIDGSESGNGGAEVVKARIPGIGTVSREGRCLVVIERDVDRDDPPSVEVRNAR